MRFTKETALLLCLALALGPMAGCSAKRMQPETTVQAVQASEEIPPAQRLDVGVQVLDPGLGELDELEAEEKGIYTDLRNSEARFISVQLRDTLESTGNWGAVRAVPAEIENMDLMVSGEILRSTGMDLLVHVRAVDSSGREWLDRKYRCEADPEAYRDERQGDPDEEGAVQEPYQNLYNQIANDLLEFRRELDPQQLGEIRSITGLRFAAELSPEAFGDYLGVDKKGRYTVEQLPARGDSMMERISTIRSRDDLLVDTLDGYYAGFHGDMRDAYDELRAFSFEEQLALKKMKRKAIIQGIVGALLLVGAAAAGSEAGASDLQKGLADAAAITGFLVIQGALAKNKETKMHVEGLRELAASFDAEIEPALVDVEGETLRLTGSAETQYAEWRRLLREIYAEETGLPVTTEEESAPAPDHGDP